MVLAFVSTFFFPTEVANAGFFSSFLDLFTNQTKAEEQVLFNVNSQTADLIKAVPVSFGEEDKKSNNLVIIESSAITTSSGPMGTIADVEDIIQGNGRIDTYVVRKGDNISKIAKMFSVSANTIRWANDLISDTLREGQTLVILPISGIKHIVKSGDTIQSIAKKYGGDINEILGYNNITVGSKLAIGDEIVVPDGELRVTVTATASKPSTIISKKFASLPYYEGYYLTPVLQSMIWKSQGIHGQNAVDLATKCHCSGVVPIFASAEGVVLVSKTGGWNGGYGNYMVISHPNSTQTVYGHTTINLVSAGEIVVKGQMIGYVGSTGNSTGPHLHFEIRGAKNPF